jgi:hypothetical protein
MNNQNPQAQTHEDTGILMFAYNNEQIDYIRLALLAALSAKKHMVNNQVALMTDKGTLDWMQQSLPRDLVSKAFDHIIVEDVEHEKNIRTHYDSPWNQFQAQFSNTNKHSVFHKTPFKRSLLIDVDYIIGNNNLDHIFGTDASVAMFGEAMDLRGLAPHHYEQHLHPLGIKMWWSTAVYWQQDEHARLFFDLWEHVKENYEFYKFTYKFPGALFRTDYAVSIACHLLAGQTGEEWATRISNQPMRYMDGKDDLAAADKNGWLFLSNDRHENWKNLAVRIQDENVHFMNKRGLLRHWESAMESVC